MLEDDLNQNKASNQSIENDKEKKTLTKCEVLKVRMMQRLISCK